MTRYKLSIRVENEFGRGNGALRTSDRFGIAPRAIEERLRQAITQAYERDVCQHDASIGRVDRLVGVAPVVKDARLAGGIEELRVLFERLRF